MFFTLSLMAAETAVEVQAGATWDSEEKGATWDTDKGPVFYLYPPYNNKGEFVKTPAKVFGAIGVIPGTIIGTVIAIPLLPWYHFERTVLASNTFFGQSFSLIFGAPFYVVKIIFWDVPASWFD